MSHAYVCGRPDRLRRGVLPVRLLCRHSRSTSPSTQHTAWRVQDGAPGAIRDLAQGADGVLWIASERGLFQFDGVRFERFEPPPGQTLPPHAPHVLLALPDTSLWIGHFTTGVSVIHRGRIVTYGTEDGLPGGAVTAIARDSGGTMWAATSRGLARLVGGRWEAIDTAAGYPGGYTEPVLVDGSGSVWAVAGDGIYVLPRGAARFEKREPTGAGRRDGELDLVAAPDGSVWAVHRSYGVFPVADGRGGPPPSRTLAYADTGIYSLTWSRDNPAVAIGTSGRLVRLWLSTPWGRRGREDGGRSAQGAHHPVLPLGGHEWQSRRGRAVRSGGEPLGRDPDRHRPVPRDQAHPDRTAGVPGSGGRRAGYERDGVGRRETRYAGGPAQRR